MNNARIAILIVFVAGAAVLAGAWGLQIVFLNRPCSICLIERWPYYAIIAVGVLAKLRAPWGRKRIPSRWLLAGCGVIMVIGASLGTYHAGLEWGWWSEPAICLSTGGPSNHVLPDLSTAPIMACDRAPWRFLGLSLAGYNTIISLSLAVVAFWGALPHRRRGRIPRPSPVHGSSSLSQ